MTSVEAYGRAWTHGDFARDGQGRTWQLLYEATDGQSEPVDPFWVGNHLDAVVDENERVGVNLGDLPQPVVRLMLTSEPPADRVEQLAEELCNLGADVNLEQCAAILSRLDPPPPTEDRVDWLAGQIWDHSAGECRHGCSPWVLGKKYGDSDLDSKGVLQLARDILTALQLATTRPLCACLGLAPAGVDQLAATIREKFPNLPYTDRTPVERADLLISIFRGLLDGLSSDGAEFPEWIRK